MHHLAAHTHDALVSEHSEVLLLELRVSAISPFEKKKASVNVESAFKPVIMALKKTLLVF